MAFTTVVLEIPLQDMEEEARRTSRGERVVVEYEGFTTKGRWEPSGHGRKKTVTVPLPGSDTPRRRRGNPENRGSGASMVNTGAVWRRGRSGKWHIFRHAEHSSACGRIDNKRTEAASTELFIGDQCHSCLERLGLRLMTYPAAMDLAVGLGMILVVKNDDGELAIVDPRDAAYVDRQRAMGKAMPPLVLYDCAIGREPSYLRHAWRCARQRWARRVELRDGNVGSAATTS